MAADAEPTEEALLDVKLCLRIFILDFAAFSSGDIGTISKVWKSK